MESGIYDALVTNGLLEAIVAGEAGGQIAVLHDVDEADQPEVLARHVSDAVLRVLGSTRDEGKRVALVNDLLQRLAEHADGLPDGAIRQLHAVRPPARPGITTYGDARPSTPLSEAALLTNSHGEPSLGPELRAEIDTSDEVDLICAFVKWYGLRLLEPELRRLRLRDAPFRVITTTYLGATDRPALDRLVNDFGAEVKIQYDVLRTRLHAKAWLFRRNTGFDTAYVGSSNLSRAALLDGVEWNVRLSRIGTPGLLKKFGATFDTYWNDSTFESYDPARDRDRLDDALAEAGNRKTSDRVTVSLAGLEVRPRPYQAEMLEEIEVEREVHDRHRNLVVAATGTGKTVIAALDYRRLRDAALQRGEPAPSLLFVAHRREILQQSLRTYREVLADATFGEEYHSGTRPERWRHVFASVQALNAYEVTTMPADAFEILVVDEFHHAAAPTYRRLLNHLQPRELLGLTATPERTDGFDLLSYFGGRTAVELRLWEALSADLLCPFHYFGIADGTQLTDLQWKRGRYDEQELEKLYTGNDNRAAIVLREVRDKLSDVSSMRALGFCVSIAHADYMAKVFNDAGIPARSVSGLTPTHERDQALRDLKDRRVNALFAADLFNEGLDLPEVNTVLFLRPTESPTVFLQQLGRGLRQADGKPVLTALDFVGHQRKEFRFDLRFRALTGNARRGLERQVEQGFPLLPSGCEIVLDKVAQEVVLSNLRGQVTGRWQDMVKELKAQGEQTLPTFLDESGADLSDVLRTGRSWTALRRDAGLPTRQGSAHESGLLRRVRALAHVDDPERLQTYRRLLQDDGPTYDELPPTHRTYARMLFFSLWPNGGGFSSYADGLNALRQEQAVRDELLEVTEFAMDHARHRTHRLANRLSDLPLRVHAQYQREEILAALDYANLQRRPSTFQSGVVYSQERNVDAFLVTLTKSEADYSPTTMYRDYAISPTLFHWESQSNTSVDSPTGQRYLNHRDQDTNILIFARQHKLTDLGTAPYLFLGPATYTTHTGSRPIAITWHLTHPMPTEVFQAASVVA
ncbi:superfamily II DNA or RNA helicase [Kribbella rubisoli]|uniref:Superfamily II DNA or RNA helicase n=1 Tax=Kribbella rubisoli TaxID=3075929 RepID=A0A4Q7XFJ0_9ACTN|nr:DEAD/DEAH box helicase [Kribbella rubisoli]RZU22300.1 superfamily II DNA or RNA helicase [Kribbella rubisoli]